MVKYIGAQARYGVFETQTLHPTGVESEFALIYQIGTSASILVTLDGVVQQPGVAYTIAEGGRKIVFSFTPDSGTPVVIRYLGRELAVPAVQGSYPIRIREYGTGTRTEYDLVSNLGDHGVLIEDGLIIFVDKQMQCFGDDWTLDVGPAFDKGTVVRFAVPPANGAKIDFYIHGLERSDLVTVPDRTIGGTKYQRYLIVRDTDNPINHVYTHNLTVTNNPVAQYDIGILRVQTHTGFQNSFFQLKTNAVVTDNITPVTLFEEPVVENGACWFTVKVIAVDLDNAPGSNKTFATFIRGAIRKNQGSPAEIFDLTFDHDIEEGNTGYDVVVTATNDNLLVSVYGDGDSTHWAGTLEKQCISFNNLLIEPPSVSDGEQFGDHSVGLAQQYIFVDPIQLGEEMSTGHNVGSTTIGPAGGITSGEIVSSQTQIKTEILISEGIASQETFGLSITVLA